MKNGECIIEQYRGGKLVRVFVPSGDPARPWRMEVNGKCYLRTNGWVLSKILPTLVRDSVVTTLAVATDRRHARKKKPVPGRRAPCRSPLSE